MPTIRVRGVPDPAASRASLADTVDGIHGARGVRVEAGRADQEPAELDGEFVELELSGGFRLWAPTDTIARDLGVPVSRDGTPPELPTALSLGGASRSGAGEIAIQTVTTFEIEIAGGIADFIKNRVEKGREPGGQLLQCVTPSAAAFAPPGRLAGTGPVLVFIHGTASSTDGSFGGLWEAVGANRILRIDNPGARVNALFEHYQGRVLALEHRSLSESPITNALALAKQLAEIVPAGAELHLVSHSRGGLIGELLCRGMRREGPPFDETDLRLFEDAAADPDATREGRAKDRASLRELGRVLKDRRYRIGRFVRVACPAAGTTLADGRLDRYASMLVNVAGRVSGLSENPLYVALTNLLAAVLKERTKPESLPGLEAMMPISPLVRMVNRRDVITEAGLHVLGGDIAISGFWSALKVLATDFYYRDDHDLVVNTPSMLRGMPRATTVKYFIDTDGDVSHFNYFRRGDTASRLTDILTTGKAELRDLTVASHAVDSDAYIKRDGAALPVLFLVPGFMGSHLSVAGGRVWASTARLAQGGLALLEGGAKVTPDGLVGVYQELVTHLSATHDVVLFAYDWRLPIAVNAAALRKAIEARLVEATGDAAQPIRILTHGSGGLVLQAMLASPDGQTTWGRVSAHPAARVLVLGHPFGGTVHADLALEGEGPLAEGLAAIDLVNDAPAIARILGSFDGLHALTAAKAPAAAAYGVFDLTRTTFVAGTAVSTPVAVKSVDGERILDVTHDGDGYSAWRDIPDAIRRAVCLATEDHGGLVTSEDLRPALVELLMTGRTQRLAALPSTAGRDAIVPGPPLRRLQAIPDDAELVAAGVGVGVRRRTVARPRVKVTVVHGNLSRANSPVVVGHYDQDGFANAEDYLDRQMNGRLRERHLMRLYPAAIGTVAVEIRPEGVPAAAHPGAVVVGLGIVGALTAGSLLQTLEEGFTAYGAERVAEQLRRRQESELRELTSGESSDGPHDTERPVIPAPLTALLVGSGEAGLTLRDSLHALLRAAQGANLRLYEPAADAKARKELVLPSVARIDALEIIELYEDRAVEALRTLLELTSVAEFAEDFDITSTVQTGAEGRQRVSFEEQAAWWQRLRVTEQDASIDPKFPTHRRVLKFEAFSERARIDAYAVNSQRELANAFIGDAMGTTAADQSLGRALFEMIVPNEIKERAPDRRDTVLLLDAQSASIPWELLEDGLRRDRQARRPLAIEAGMVRQLVDEHGRTLIRQATGDGALVVGNPPVADPRFANLPGAEAEAKVVAAQLTRRYTVRSFIGASATPRAILAALHDRPWRVLHLALHGVFEFPAVAGKPEPVTGAVVGRHVYLTPSDFNQMRYVPDLVFLNCCHSGNTTGTHQPRYPELAANLATQFIKMGTKAVVAAGWAVDDKAARAFAQVFYTQMLEGRPFGRATLAARDAIYRRFSHVNTWGAYQCYGDPDFALDATGRASTPRAPLCLRELVLDVDTVASIAKSAEDRAIAGLRTRLDDVVKAADERWLADARLSVALGTAYGELREFERAIDFYERARLAEKAEVTVVALEQLANLKSRYAEHIWRDSKERQKVQKKVDGLLAEAERLLGQLVGLEPSAERHALLGGVAKRRVMTRTTPAAMAAALVEMGKQYQASYEIKRDRKQRDAFYPFINKAVATLALSWLRPSAAKPAAARPKSKAKAKAGSAPDASLNADIVGLGKFDEKLKDATDFWSLGYLAESALIRALHDGKPAAVTARAMVERYRRAQRRGRSRREMDSVVTQIHFLARVATEAKAKPVRDLGTALVQLARQLSETPG